MEDEHPEYISGARFIEPERSIDRWMYPRDPSKYNPSGKFRDRFNHLAGIVDGSDIADAINYGELYPASSGCVTFVKDAGGVVFYVVVTSDISEYLDQKELEEGANFEDLEVDKLEHTIVTLWPYVNDRERAWATGRWTGQQLDIVEEIEPDIEE